VILSKLTDVSLSLGWSRETHQSSVSDEWVRPEGPSAFTPRREDEAGQRILGELM
jgi:hypothetical protein